MPSRRAWLSPCRKRCRALSTLWRCKSSSRCGGDAPEARLSSNCTETPSARPRTSPPTSSTNSFRAGARAGGIYAELSTGGAPNAASESSALGKRATSGTSSAKDNSGPTSGGTEASVVCAPLAFRRDFAAGLGVSTAARWGREKLRERRRTPVLRDVAHRGKRPWGGSENS
jgi:hypothetical protein